MVTHMGFYRDNIPSPYFEVGKYYRFGPKALVVTLIRTSERQWNFLMVGDNQLLLPKSKSMVGYAGKPIKDVNRFRLWVSPEVIKLFHRDTNGKLLEVSYEEGDATMSNTELKDWSDRETLVLCQNCEHLHPDGNRCNVIWPSPVTGKDDAFTVQSAHKCRGYDWACGLQARGFKQKKPKCEHKVIKTITSMSKYAPETGRPGTCPKRLIVCLDCLSALNTRASVVPFGEAGACRCGGQLYEVKGDGFSTLLCPTCRWSGYNTKLLRNLPSDVDTVIPDVGGYLKVIPGDSASRWLWRIERPYGTQTEWQRTPFQVKRAPREHIVVINGVLVYPNGRPLTLTDDVR